MNSSERSSSAQRVQDALLAAGLEVNVKELSESTRSAADAARALNCDQGQIAKSLAFRTRSSHKPILAIASGSNRVDLDRLAKFTGEPLERMPVADVKATTGYAIGGVPPLGHLTALPVYFDQDLLKYKVVWAAAGTPFAIFSSEPSALARAAGAQIIEMAEKA